MNNDYESLVFPAFGLFIVIAIIIYALKDSEKKLNTRKSNQILSNQIRTEQHFDNTDFHVASNIVDYARSPTPDMTKVSNIASTLHQLKHDSAKQAAKEATKLITDQINNNRQNYIQPQPVQPQQIVYVDDTQPVQPQRVIRRRQPFYYEEPPRPRRQAAYFNDNQYYDEY